jgi:hypothetical protein
MLRSCFWARPCGGIFPADLAPRVTQQFSVQVFEITREDF